MKPETSNGWEAGIKLGLANDKIQLTANYFDTRFRNLVIRENIGGRPALANAGAERFRGLDIEASVTPVKDFTASASYAMHVAKFTDYARVQPDGSLQQLAGNRLELSPKFLATAQFAYTPETGPNAAATLRYVGKRFLNKRNTAIAADYTTIDARLGYRWKGGWGAFVDAQNLTNRRDAVSESEIGDAQFYRLSGRRVLFTIERRFDFKDVLPF